MSVDHSARAEDLRWLAATGENLTGAARRLGITVCALEKWAQLHGMRDELAVLRGREVVVPGDRREVGRRNAERRWAS